MNDIVKRMSVEDIFSVKIELLGKIKQFDALDGEISALYESVNSGNPMYINHHWGNCGEDCERKHVDRSCWRYLVQMFEVERYTLCTQFKDIEKKIEEFNFPEFTVENAYGYIDSLRETIYSNVRTMMKTVYANLCDGAYYTGGGYNAPKKKRNNNGIDKMFIISTRDYSRVFGYYGDTPTITDDLEKLCYILDGKRLPDQTIIRTMRAEKASEWSNEYFTLKVCKNGNAHYKIEDEIRAKLNVYGPEPGRIGEDIKIKVFDRW